MSYMTFFLAALVACSVVITIVTEAIKTALKKKIDDEEISANQISGICAVILGVIAAVVGVVFKEDIFVNIDWNWAKYTIYSLGLIVASWIGSMVGYDKVIQTIKQLVTQRCARAKRRVQKAREEQK